MKNKMILCLSMLFLFCAMCIIENKAESSKPIENSSNKISSVYALAGEFRIVFANLLWIKVEQYHHEYIEHHPDWTKNTDILGLIKMITALDPHFEEAYTSGAMLYAEGSNDKEKARNFLLEGLRNNPKSYELNKSMAMLYAVKFKDTKHALPYAEKAYKYCNDDFYKNVSKKLVDYLKKETLKTNT